MFVSSFIFSYVQLVFELCKTFVLSFVYISVNFVFIYFIYHIYVSMCWFSHRNTERSEESRQTMQLSYKCSEVHVVRVAQILQLLRAHYTQITWQIIYVFVFTNHSFSFFPLLSGIVFILQHCQLLSLHMNYHFLSPCNWKPDCKNCLGPNETQET